ncbi:MAG: YlzJ-like protein [Firmicutes bacterium]|nr:YlzJ-like protein [Bacillota bacterium]
MIIWSIFPEEMVMSNVVSPPDYEEIECSGMKCLVEKIGPRQCRVVRLLTTDPRDYLRTELQPGTILTYEPILKALS